MMPKTACRAIIFGVAAWGLFGGLATAGTYPIAGMWTYDNPTEGKPAPRCGRRYMEFRGAERFDTAGGVPAYRNVAVEGSGPSWRVVDEFLTVQIRGRVTYTLRLIDADHLELQLAGTGKRILLRRCGS